MHPPTLSCDPVYAMLSALNSITTLLAENALTTTQAGLQQTLTQLSTGKRINSGADDAAGLSIVDSLHANIAALTQSSQNTVTGIAQLQTADSALSNVVTLLTRAVTLATEAANGSLTQPQSTALNTEFTAILAEITRIGVATNFNGEDVFNAPGLTPASLVFSTDAVSSSTLSTSITQPSPTNLDLAAADLLNATDAASALTAIDTAISSVAALRGSVGAAVNNLTAEQNIDTTTAFNLTAAANNIEAADIGKTTAHLAQLTLLQQTGIAALAQANRSQQALLQLIKDIQ